jgi:molybdopterin-containing oxidoreductase family molybdopterin binding subunit
VSWDEAYDYIVERLKRVADRHGWRSNAWITMSGNYGFRAFTAPPRVSNCLGGTLFSSAGLSGDASSFMGFQSTLGTFICANDFSEIGGARYFLSVGKNLADTAHSEMHFLFDAMEQGCKFVMIDPRFSRSAAKADEWIAPRPGTDGALAIAMINVLISEGLIKRDYIIKHTNAPFLLNSDTGALVRERDIVPGGGGAYLVWDSLIDAAVSVDVCAQPALEGEWELVGVDGASIKCSTVFSASWAVWRDFTPEHAADICELSAAQIRKIAIDYATADPASIWFGFGPQRYSNGLATVRAWIILTALCGNIGKPHAGISMGEGSNMPLAMGVGDSWLKPGGKSGHNLTGTRMVETIASGDPYPVESLWITSFNFATQTSVFKRFLAEALPKLELFVVTEQLMTGTAEYADVVLPCVSYYEDDWDLVGSQENWTVQLRRRAISPRGESRSDFEIFAGLCDRLNLGQDWHMDPEEMCRTILADHPDPRIRAVDWETLRRDGVATVPVERPYTPFRDMSFKTPSGRIEIYLEQFADLGEALLVYKEPTESRRSSASKRYPLNFITYKHVHSAHSQHLMLPSIREVLPEPRLEISSKDATSRAIATGDVVEVVNDRGSFKVRATVTESMRPGTVAMPQGWWKREFIDGSPSDLGQIPQNEVQNRIMETNSPLWDILCEVRKIDK